MTEEMLSRLFSFEAEIGTQENVICNYYLQSWRNQILSQDTRWISMEKVALDLQLYA